MLPRPVTMAALDEIKSFVVKVQLHNKPLKQMGEASQELSVFPIHWNLKGESWQFHIVADAAKMETHTMDILKVQL